MSQDPLAQANIGSSITSVELEDGFVGILMNAVIQDICLSVGEL